MSQNRRHVVGIVESACAHEPWEESLNIVIVGFGPPQFGSQRSECI